MGKLKSNITYNFIYQLLIMLLPFITAPYLARKIGAGGIGIYTFSQSVVTYFTYITLLGLGNYGTRAIALVQSDREKRSRVFCEIYCMQFICFIVSILLYIPYVYFLSVDKKAALIMIIWEISAVLDINWFFFGMEKFKLTVVRNAVVKILTVLCIFIFVHNEEHIYRYVAIMSISTFMSSFCLWPFLKSEIDVRLPRWSELYKHFRPNFILFLPAIAVSIYRMMDKIMLGYMSTMEEVGFYENAEKIIGMIQSLIVAIGTVMLPRMTAVYSKESKTSKNKYFDISMVIVMAYAVAAFFGILSVKDIFVSIYFGKGFEKTATILALLAVTIIFFGMGNVLRTQYLIPQKKDSIYIKSAFLGALVNLVINIFFIPKYGSVGAAIATILAEASVCLYQFIKVKSEISIWKYCSRLFLYIVFGVIMYLVILILPVFESEIITMVEYIFVGALVFLSLFGGEYLLCKRKKTNLEDI